MSLQVWLPLNGSLENQGLNDVIVTNNGVTVDNNGKIGKCYRFDGDVYLNLSKGMDTTKDYSICYWVKEFENNTLGQFRVVYQCGGLIVGQYGTYLNIYNSSGSGLDVTAAIDTTTWHHACFTFQSSENLVTIYIDGKYATSKTVTSIPTSSSSAVIGKRSSGTHLFQGTLNDFRIYDHCLSPKEVQELAKGLVLHYRLAGPGRPNLLSYQKIIKQNNVSFSYDASTLTFTTKTPTTSTLYGVTMNTDNCVIPWNHVGIMSMDILSPVATTFCRDDNDFAVSGNSWSGNDNTSRGSVTTTVPANKWTKVIIYSINNQSSNTNHESVKVQSSFNISATDVEFKFKNVKFEVSPISTDRNVTPWCPASDDTLYAAMGYSNNIEYDCSGYGRNGTKGDNIIWDVNSARYTTSYKFDNKDRISMPDIPFQNFKEGTFSIWLKVNSYGIWTHYAFFANSFNWTGQGIDSIIIANHSASTNAVILDCCSYISQHSLALNTWNLCTITWDKNYQIKKYVNGQLIATHDDSVNKRLDTYMTKHGTCGLGNVTQSDSYKGDFNLTDCRIYATALSAAAIEELYHSAVIVDNTGKTYAYEYFEAT